MHDKQLTDTTSEGRICGLVDNMTDDKQLPDITQISVVPIFQFDYSAENEYYSNRSQSRYINQKELNIPVTVLLKIV